MNDTWAVILAGGDGTRLATLTRDAAGTTVPKQFCSLAGGRALLGEALQRARYVTRPERICVVVSDRHRQYWQPALAAVGSRNLLSQPANRGTAIAILLAVLHILRRDPQARVLVLPADHYVGNEAMLGGCLRDSVRLLASESGRLVLVGIEAERPEPDLGYLVPHAPVPGRALRIARFIEKPGRALAEQLLAVGAVWNSFIFAARGTELLALLRACCPQATAALAAARGAGRRSRSRRRSISRGSVATGLRSPSGLPLRCRTVTKCVAIFPRTAAARPWRRGK